MILQLINVNVSLNMSPKTQKLPTELQLQYTKRPTHAKMMKITNK